MLGSAFVRRRCALTSKTLLDPSGSVAKLEFPSSRYIRYVGLIGTIWDTTKGIRDVGHGRVLPE